ncbi:uncharacterized protein V6R79_018107 [Siganus canaliculatus]
MHLCLFNQLHNGACSHRPCGLEIQQIVHLEDIYLHNGTLHPAVPQPFPRQIRKAQSPVSVLGASGTRFEPGGGTKMATEAAQYRWNRNLRMTFQREGTACSFFPPQCVHIHDADGVCTTEKQTITLGLMLHRRNTRCVRPRRR